ncbi:uncharacterized protein LOC124917068 [Impatiens glandulifera]|uniref:uncharacterized protein LOC124917068 n=1 Tax=Impatiens glandulifera TaxID=253017 RepID=UPI001FB19356|nr:uncharacterized protein LOC124917068 [Impatiens glandulifera]
MVDSRPVINQVQEIQVILHEIHAEGMNLRETFQVAAIIEKLPPSWNDFKNYLKHNRKEMNVEELVIRLHIEEENKSATKKYFSQHVAKANVVEHGKDKKKQNCFVKNRNINPKGGISKKFTGKCINCNGMGHRYSDCKKSRRVRETNLTQGLSDMDLCAMISEINLVGSNPREWWVDTGATRHVCSNKEVFLSLEEVKNGEKLFMGNFSTSDIQCEGKVVLRRHPAVIEWYTDVNWILDMKDSKSTSGYVFTLRGAAISWKSSKQTIIARSTMESEYIALEKCGEKVKWLRLFLEDIPIWSKPVLLYPGK